MSHFHNFTKTSAVTSVITTEQSAVILNNVRITTAEYGTMPWRMIIDQANAAADFFNKTNWFAQNKSANRFESRIRMLYLYHEGMTHNVTFQRIYHWLVIQNTNATSQLEGTQRVWTHIVPLDPNHNHNQSPWKPQNHVKTEHFGISYAPDKQVKYALTDLDLEISKPCHF